MDYSWIDKVRIVRGELHPVGNVTADEMYMKLVSEELERRLDDLATVEQAHDIYSLMINSFPAAEALVRETFPDFEVNRYGSESVLVYFARRALDSDGRFSEL